MCRTFILWIILDQLDSPSLLGEVALLLEVDVTWSWTTAPPSRWDVSNATHIWPMPTDNGVCRVPWGPCLSGYAEALRDSVKLQHFGGVMPMGRLPLLSEE